MAITAKTEFEPRDLVPPGNYFGVVVGVYDIGTQPSEKYDPVHKIILQFELHKKKGPALTAKNEPLMISGFYPLAFGINQKTKKASKLREAVEGILGKTFTDAEAKAGYDVTRLLEKGCRLTVAHDKDEKGNPTYDYIKSYMPLDDDDPQIESLSNCIVYELDTASDIPDDVPKWVQKQIRKSLEWVKVHGAASHDDKAKPKAHVGGNGNGNGKPARDAGDDDDDVPF